VEVAFEMLTSSLLLPINHGSFRPVKIGAVSDADGQCATVCLKRDPEAVLTDVRNGYVSIEAARRDYGVVVRHPSRRVYELDRSANEALRRARES
jgi:hypothetical protein